MKRNRVWLGVIACSAISAVACDSTQVLQPVANESSVSAGPLKPVPPTAKAFSCPTQDEFTTTSQVGPLGGSITAGGVTVAIPAGALLSAVTMSVTVPASSQVELDVSVEGAEHFVFELPVVVTVSYARCSRSNIDHAPITAWHFDPATGELLEPMPSVDNKLLRTVTFTTGHLSGYILAN